MSLTITPSVPLLAAWDGEIVQTGSNFTTTTTANLVTVLQTPNVLANTVFEFEVVFMSNSSTAAGIVFGINTGSGSGSVGCHGFATETTNFAISALNTGTGAQNTTADQRGGFICGWIKTAGTGTDTIIFSVAKVTSGTATIYINSRLKWRQMIP